LQREGRDCVFDMAAHCSANRAGEFIGRSRFRGLRRISESSDASHWAAMESEVDWSRCSMILNRSSLNDDFLKKTARLT